MFYVLDYFTSVLNTYLGARFLKEAARAPAMTGLTGAVAAVVPYDPAPYLQESQYRFPLLAAYRKKEAWKWRTVMLRDDVGEWEIQYILPPVTAAQMERMAPFLRSVGSVINDRIENVFDPSYLNGAHVWALAGLEEIELSETSYGALQGTGGLVFPTWKGKLTVKEISAKDGASASLPNLTYVNSMVTLRTRFAGDLMVFNLSLVEKTPDFYSGFLMQQATFPLQVPVSITAPANVSENEATGVFFPGSFHLQVSGTFVGTYLFEGSVDGINWFDITASLYNETNNANITTITAPGIYSNATATPTFVRVRCSAYTSGTPVMTISGII